MNPPFRYIFSALALGSLCVILSLRAAGENPDSRVARLDQLVALTPEQKIAIAQIFQTEEKLLAALPPDERAVKGANARQNSRQQIRAILNREQRNKYDFSPQSMGGGKSAFAPKIS